MNKIVYRLLTFTLIGLMVSTLSTSAAVEELDETEVGDRYSSLFIEFFSDAFDGIGIKSTINSNEDTFTGLDQGLALVTLIQLFDVYNDTTFLFYAQNVADYIFTLLLDPRYDLIANYYSEDSGTLSNYRNVVDNFLISWGLHALADRIPESQALLKNDYQNRAEKVSENLGLVVSDDQFIEKLRIDAPTSPLQFKTYHNLMTAFIILESDNTEITEYTEKAKEIYDFITDNLVGANGEVFTLYYNGFVDDLTILKNQALYINVGLQLAEIYGENYQTNVMDTVDYVRTNFADLGITRGYFDALRDGGVIQESKSLSSHALLLIAFLKLADTQDIQAELDIIRIWDTIEKHFKSDSIYYYSTIDRSGNLASPTIYMVDNMLLLFALSRMPIIRQVDYAYQVDFRDQALFNVTHSIPTGVPATFLLSVEDEVALQTTIIGTGEVTTTTLLIDLERPSQDFDVIEFSLELISANITTDSLDGTFTVVADTGIEFEPSQILLFTGITLTIFVITINRLDFEKVLPSQ